MQKLILKNIADYIAKDSKQRYSLLTSIITFLLGLNLKL